MAIPDFQKLMLPPLEYLADGEVRRVVPDVTDDAVYVPAKKYVARSGVGRPALQAFAGSLEAQRAAKGVFITTPYFTADAEDYVRRISRRIVLVDGRMLARLMHDYGIAVRSHRSLDIKRLDDAYFEGDV